MEPADLPRAGRRRRLRATVLVGALLVLGSAYGTDGDFPFGPFRMFATSGRTTGAVRVAVLAGVTDDGAPVEITPDSVGIRRAELEGRYAQFRSDPSLLAGLAELYEGRHGVPLDEVTLEQSVQRVVDRRVQPGQTTIVVARWVR